MAMRRAFPLVDPGLEARVEAVDTILFDATGTLIEVRGSVGERYAALAAGHGIALDPGRADRAFAAALSGAPPLCFPGVPPPEREAAAADWWRAVVAETLKGSALATGAAAPPPDPPFEPFFQRLYAHFAGTLAWTPARDARHVLVRLARRGFRLGVLSNFDGRLPGILAALGLEPYLARIETSVSLGRAKPDPRAFQEALDRLGSTPERAAHVGDSLETDAAGAADAGLLPVLLRRPLPRGLAGFRIDRLRDLLGVFATPGSRSGAPPPPFP
jgi:putative hydrolase of the HAD superfamily